MNDDSEFRLQSNGVIYGEYDKDTDTDDYTLYITTVNGVNMTDYTLGRLVALWKKMLALRWCLPCSGVCSVMLSALLKLTTGYCTLGDEYVFEVSNAGPGGLGASTKASMQNGLEMVRCSPNGSLALALREKYPDAGPLELVRFLLAEGAACDPQNEEGHTPLHLASVSQSH